MSEPAAVSVTCPRCNQKITPKDELDECLWCDTLIYERCWCGTRCCSEDCKTKWDKLSDLHDAYWKVSQAHFAMCCARKKEKKEKEKIKNLGKSHS